MVAIKTDNTIKPFLRWAGGKNWLVKHLDLILPKDGFNNYHEPFLGGASMFLSIYPKNEAFLSDLNRELIETYSTLKVNPEGIIDILRTFENTEKFYYQIRERRYEDPLEQAARFVFLNQTSFNGIYRVNLNGKYNVPYGYRTKDFLEAEKLRLVSKRLKNATLDYGDFTIVESRIQKGDLVFLDPPYTVSHNDNGFIKYNQKLFSLDDQKRLSDLIDFIKAKEAFYILTNAAHKTIEEIFDKGDRVLKINRASLIGGANAERGQTTECIFTNISK
ncbi:Dam family site-specific DNA-(adenine-N6)-methyltransferase [Maribellus sp. CM-23]|uniref:DNA adenine methylase n=1 Tax=Maribellus sp. CM-23 TaxID=2781026 RepID=UPI001F262ECE|nr:Dam family site-specific DNA-(adenine-N6)-methyltransferase [Maribellus sp. CM-23]MCE4566108.1 Dam family site-specific DNA-(adenine-N6)-methyltransferase [Maribellus sp. CM-23]